MTAPKHRTILCPDKCPLRLWTRKIIRRNLDFSLRPPRSFGISRWNPSTMIIRLPLIRVNSIPRLTFVWSSCQPVNTPEQRNPKDTSSCAIRNQRLSISIRREQSSLVPRNRTVRPQELIMTRVTWTINSSYLREAPETTTIWATFRAVKWPTAWRIGRRISLRPVSPIRA